MQNINEALLANMETICTGDLTDGLWTIYRKVHYGKKVKKEKKEEKKLLLKYFADFFVGFQQRPYPWGTAFPCMAEHREKRDGKNGGRGSCKR